MRGVVRPLLCLPLLLLGAVAIGRESPQDPDIASDPPATAAGAPLQLGEIEARLTVPVALGTRGPYPFVIDTGAERTVVSRELAGSLRLAPGRPVSLMAMTGRSMVDTVVVPHLSIESIGETHALVAPALEARNLGAAGLLGIDTLRDHQVSIDFEKNTMAVRPSQRRPARAWRSDGEIVVRAKSQFGQLIVTDAYYGNTRIQVVLDTGSQVTMGNSALQRRIGRRMAKLEPIELTSVTGGKLHAGYTFVPGIRVGDVRFGAMPIAFADVAPFERFGLVRRPALLLGMDALRSFRRVEIDFPNRQVRFLMPKGLHHAPFGGAPFPGLNGESAL